MTYKYHSDIDETVYSQTLPNGLLVYIVPKNGFNKTYVSLTAPIGSTTTSFTLDDEAIDIPAGVAHFLEHKLFEQDGKDISEVFSEHSARVNAFTTNTRTSYLFSATDHVLFNTKTLCDFVMNPSFTTEGIKKEVGIISQEIKMYEDDSNNRLYMGLLQKMYPKDPLSLDILGTEESIHKIDKDILTKTHKAFYNPHQLLLLITGKVDVEKTFAFLEEEYKSVSPNPSLTVTAKERINTDEVLGEELAFDVLQANTLLGIKFPVFDFDQVDYIKTELSLAIFAEMMFGKGTAHYQSLLEKELINDSFGTDITLEQDYAFFLVGGNTNNIEALQSEMRKIINTCVKTSIKETHFKRILHQIVGGFVNSLNIIEYIANQFTHYKRYQVSLFDMLDIAKSISIEDIDNVKQYFANTEEYYHYSIVPKK